MIYLYRRSKNTALNKRYAFRRTVRAAPGSEKPQSGYALGTVFSPPHLGQGTLLRKSYNLPQTSYTTERYTKYEPGVTRYIGNGYVSIHR